MKVREPVARPLDIVALELLLSASQALVTGVLVYLAVGTWEDRGVGAGPVAVILAALGLAVGGAWLFWLLGGTGWPLAAANVPSALFLAFAMLLGWQGAGLAGLDALPLVLTLVASVYGIACGVFLDSPRRWRWDQRQRLRHGAQVPTISPATRAAVARIPRSVPRRARRAGPPVAMDPADPSMTVEAGRTPGSSRSGAETAGAALPEAPSGWAVDPGPGAAGTRPPGEPDDAPGMATDRLPAPAPAPTSASGARTGPAADAKDTTAAGGKPALELPTSVEPKAQRSPWAWAAPPEWTRDEDDEPAPSSRR